MGLSVYGTGIPKQITHVGITHQWILPVYGIGNSKLEHTLKV